MQDPPQEGRSAREAAGCLGDLFLQAAMLAVGLLVWALVAVGFRQLLNPTWGAIVGLVAVPLAFEAGTVVGGFVLLLELGLRGLAWAMKLPFRLLLRRPLVGEGEEELVLDRMRGPWIGFAVGCFATGAAAGVVLSFGAAARLGAVASALAAGAMTTLGCALMIRLGLEFQ